MGFLIQMLVTAGLLLVVAKVVSGIRISSPTVAVISALVLGLANALVRPFIVLLTLPLTILTLGLFLIVINALMLQLAAALVRGFDVKGFRPAVVGSVVLTVLNLVVDWLVR